MLSCFSWQKTESFLERHPNDAMNGLVFIDVFVS